MAVQSNSKRFASEIERDEWKVKYEEIYRSMKELQTKLETLQTVEPTPSKTILTKDEITQTSKAVLIDKGIESESFQPSTTKESRRRQSKAARTIQVTIFV